MEKATQFWQRFREWNPLRMLTGKIRYKILLGFLVVSLIPLFFLGVSLYRHASQALMTQRAEQLNSVTALKTQQLETHFRTLENQLLALAENPLLTEAMTKFQTSFGNIELETGATSAQMEVMRTALAEYYTKEYAGEFEKLNADTSPALIAEMKSSLESMPNGAVILQYHYLKDNEHSHGKKQKLDHAGDPSSYSTAHATFHPVLRTYQEKLGLDDLLLLDAETGSVLYSVVKTPEFSTSLKSGEYADTNLAELFRRTTAAGKAGQMLMVDFKSYKPAWNLPAGFMATPLVTTEDDLQQRVGILVFRLPIAPINKMLTNYTGLGNTGETYAVGPDYLFRNESRFTNELGIGNTIINQKFPVRTSAALAALKGGEEATGTKLLDGYMDAPVLSSYAPVTVHAGTNEKSDPAIHWAVVTDLALAEVRQPAQSMFLTALFVGILAVLIVCSLGLLFSKTVTKQTDSILEMLSAVGEGNFDARAEVMSDDELGTIAESVNSLCDNTLNLIQSREQRDKLEAAVERLKREVSAVASGDLTVHVEVEDDLTGDIADSMNYMVAQLREIISNVQDATLQVSSSANEIQTTTEHLSAGSEAQSTQILDTSTAIEEMASSIQQVSENTQNSAEVANKARETAHRGHLAVQNTIQGMDRIRDQVQESSKRIKRLGETSQEVGEIVQLISDIADRTSILALNASIQAAMAGDAGQGFAVVAEEVERLAERCNEATRQIATLIKAIQNDTNEAISAMEESTREVVDGSKLAAEAGQSLQEIDDVSDRLAELITMISQAATQQARGAEAVARSMSEIADVTQQTAAGTKQAAVSVSNLAHLADSLYGSVGTFKLPAYSGDSDYRLNVSDSRISLGTSYSGIYRRTIEDDDDDQIL